MSSAPVSPPCRAFLDDFSDFVDGHLSPSRLAEIQAHVDCCQRCLDHLTAYRRGITVLRSIESGARADFWARLEGRIWPEEGLTVVAGGKSGGSRVGRLPGPAVGLAAAAVLALFVILRGLGPDSTAGRLGPERIQASVVMTVPEVPDAETGPAGSRDGAATGMVARARSASRSNPAPWSNPAPEPADPAEATLARVDARATVGFEREIRRLRDRVFDRSLGREAMESALVSDGWIEPVRLGGDWSRPSFHRAALVRPVSAVRPAPWNVDQAASLP